MAYWHSLYDTELYDKIHAANCDFGGANMSNLTEECMQYGMEFEELVQDVNIYDIYGTCWGLGDSPQLYASRDSKQAATSADYTPWAHRFSSEHRLKSLPPCTFGTPIIDYLNRGDVRTNLHIPSDIQAWDLCQDDIDYTVNEKGSMWIYEEL